jgi:hypothetical protein
MRYLNYLIKQVRRETENEEFTADTGIQDIEFIQYINDAQHRLQSVISAQHPKVFLSDEEIDVVNGQSSYSLPSDTYLDNRVHLIEYSIDGTETGYYPLDEVSLRRISSGATGSPDFYVRSTGKIILNPAPTLGKIRVTYSQKVKELDLRRAQVSTLASPITTVSEGLVVDLNTSSVQTDTDSLSEHDYLCVVDKEGNSKMKNIPIKEVSSSTIILEAHTPLSGESIDSSDFIVGGKDASTHSTLPRSLERYLLTYCTWKIQKRDSSSDSQEAQMELLAMEKDIVDSYSNISDDIQEIPILTSWEDWSL